MELLEFLREFVVSTLYCLDLKDPSHIRIIQNDIEISEVSKGKFCSNGAILLAERLGEDVTSLAKELLVLFKLEEFVNEASSDDEGNIYFDLKMPQNV